MMGGQRWPEEFLVRDAEQPEISRFSAEIRRIHKQKGVRVRVGQMIQNNGFRGRLRIEKGPPSRAGLPFAHDFDSRSVVGPVRVPQSDDDRPPGSDQRPDPAFRIG